MTKVMNDKGLDILVKEGVISPEEYDKMVMEEDTNPDIRVVRMGGPEGVENLMSILDGVLGEDKSPKEIAMYKFIQGLSVCRSNVETLSEMVGRDEVVNVLTNILDVVEKGAKTEGVPGLRVCMTLLAFVDSFMAHPEETLEGVMDVLSRLRNK